MRRAISTLLLSIIISVCWPQLAGAHGLVAGGARVIEAQAGAYHLRVEVTVPTGAPALMTVKILPQQAFDGVTTMVVRATHRATQADVSQTIAIPANMHTISVADLLVTESGGWDVSISVRDASHGLGEMSIPITVYPPVVPPLTIPLFVSIAVLAVVLFASTIWPPLQSWHRPVYAHLITASLSISIVLGLLMTWPNLRIEIPSGDTTSRPYVNADLMVASDSVRNVDVLRIALFDGATGLPVDDLVPHHQALMHLVLLDTTAQSFLHLHPVRSAPGVYNVDLPALPQAEYDVSIEFERVNSGSQSLRQRLELGTEPLSAVVFAPIPTEVALGDVVARISASTPIVVGQATEIRVQLLKRGQPVEALDYWLGMRGHLLIRNDARTLFAHVHAAGIMNDAFQPVSIAGDTVSFVYAFPKPDRYTIWIQVMIDGTLLSIPATVEVTSP
jgi:hypothetical protein